MRSYFESSETRIKNLEDIVHKLSDRVARLEDANESSWKAHRDTNVRVSDIESWVKKQIDVNSRVVSIMRAIKDAAR